MFTFKVKAVTHMFQKGQLLWWLQMGSVSNLLSEQVGEYLQTSWHLPYKLIAAIFQWRKQSDQPVQGKLRLSIDRQSQSSEQQEKSQINKNILAANIKT